MWKEVSYGRCYAQNVGASCSGGCGNSIAESEDSFARWQPPIRSVLNALFLLPAASIVDYIVADFS